MRITALYQGTGSKYHRILLFLNNAKFYYPDLKVKIFNTKVVTEDMVKGCDFLMFNWRQLTKVEHLSDLRDKYKFKIIQDLDDYWNFPFGHYLNKRPEVVDQVKLQIQIADLVFCSTEFLMEKASILNKNVILRKNFLPVGSDQFTIEAFKKRDKIRVGFCGSSSHMQDWLSLEGPLKRVMSSSFITDRCEFVIAGYHESMKRLIPMLTYYRKKVAIRPILISFRPVENYMSLYSELDFVLAPLLINDFNKAKSDLKLLESACKQAVVMSGDKYAQDGNNFYHNIKDFGLYETLYTCLGNPEIFIKDRMIKSFSLLELNRIYESKYNLKKLI